MTKIEKIQEKIEDVKKERLRHEVRYNTHIVMVNGHRDTLHDMETTSKRMHSEIIKSEKKIGELMSNLQKEVELESIKNETIS